MKSILYITLVLLAGLLFTECNPSAPKADYSIENLPVIFPDYTNILIPNNIAPLNFKVNNAERCFLTISSKNGSVKQTTKNGNFIFNERKWKQLLFDNMNDTLFYELMTQDKTWKWTVCPTFYQVVSADSIDGYLAYRLINTGYVLWEKLGLYQRNLESFKQEPIIENTSLRSACMNCHSFANQSPENMMLHTRMYFSGTTIYHNEKLKKVETKTPYTLSSGVYPSWHPNGKIIAFSVNNIAQQFHAVANKRITVSDAASDLIIYNVETNEVSTCPQLSTKWKENLPSWSPDGKCLYYISAAQRIQNPPPIDAYEPYSLLCIPYNAETNTWGEADTLITPSDIHGSVTFPKLSPNGKYLVFTKAKSGYFTIHDQAADLFALDLETRVIKPLSVNSSFTESYHSFSHSGKWMVFSSKRPSGLFTRPYFTHFNDDGTTTKPFLLPQKSPDFYANYLLNYNIPEFITGKVEVSPIQLRNVILDDAQAVSFDKNVDVDALSGATAKAAK